MKSAKSEVKYSDAIGMTFGLGETECLRRMFGRFGESA
jgi:hypothetical protein